MKCTHCRSQMFVADETVNDRSQVTFYRCSVCASEHVSSEPVGANDTNEQQAYFDPNAADKKRYLMV